ncbi:MAG TPA: isocitrate/isopropylmalate family dehydrogenase, partial [Roseiflexaceae bacterium]|nr:isocitrate/isopropylmalate family dehydrogenase [Roseiflexaceae bacterium]
TVLSVAMMLRYSLGLADEAAAVEQAVAETLAAGIVTGDIGDGATAQSTSAVGQAIAERITRPTR